MARLLDEHGIKEDAITAQAIAEVLRELERIDHMIMTLEMRRDRALRELEHHRAIRAAHAPRTAPDRIEDAEYHEVEHQPVEEQHAA